MEHVAPVAIMFIIFGGCGMLSKMWTDYNRTRVEIARLKFEQRAATPVGSSREVEALRADLEATRQELRDLRDTSMQYDISFDNAIGRVENQVAHVERRIGINAPEVNVETVTLTGR